LWTGFWTQGLHLEPLHQPFFFFFSFIMCVRLGHFSSYPLLPPSPPGPLTSRQKLFFPYL
jgi:hypothetical protein